MRPLDYVPLLNCVTMERRAVMWVGSALRVFVALELLGGLSRRFWQERTLNSFL